MKFVLHKVKIWFEQNTTPREIAFLPNKINVITGDSGSGKTNILAIIDYCLLSNKVNIVEQIINESASWYSIEFSLKDNRYFLARRKMHLEQENLDICLIDECKNIPDYPFPNITITAARKLLDDKFNIVDKYPFPKEGGVFPFEFSFRTNLVFNYLTERIITLDNQFFDFDYFEKSLFGDFKEYVISKALGFDDSRLNEYKKRLQEIKRGKANFDKMQKSSQKKCESFKNQIENLLEYAVENRLLAQKIYFELDSCISDLRNITDCYMSIANAEKNNDIINALRDEKRQLELELRKIKKAEEKILKYEQNLDSYKDVLKPIEILEFQSNEIVRSYETEQLIDALKKSLYEIKNTNIQKVVNQIISPLEKSRLNKRIQELNKQIENINPNNSYIINKSNYAFVIATNIKNQLDAILKNPPKDKSNDVYMLDYPLECSKLESKIHNEERIKPSINNAVNTSIQLFYKQLSSMENYSNCEINFDMVDFLVRLKDPHKAYPYGNIGSKSNYMFLHLCLFLGLHNHFRMIGNKQIASFLFIDQPSIPYYSGSDTVNEDDKLKLLDAFRLLNNFIPYIKEKYNEDFQIILIEHAPESYWIDEHLEYFYTVETFNNGNKLIPINMLNKF